MQNDENMILDKISSDASESMCSGLLGKIAFQVKTNRPILAEDARKSDGPFYCRECLSDAIVRKCTEKDDHFAHKGRLSELFKSSESQLHLDCKEEILKGLKETFPHGKWEKERPINADKEKGFAALVPDLSGRIGDLPIAIEIQRSFLNVKKIQHRTKEYTKRGVAILWLVPVKMELGIEVFRPRLFEKYLHSMFYGRVYYWMPGYGTHVKPTHFGTSKRWIEETTWFDKDAMEERTEGGYWKNFKTIKKPTPCHKLLDLTKDFKFEQAEEWQPENEEMKIPQRLIYKDKLSKWWGD